MKKKEMEDLHAEHGDELIKVRSKRTGREVYIDLDAYFTGMYYMTGIWGQVSKTDEAGWAFDPDDLEVIEEDAMDD